jgi:hypothetical protein
VDDRYFDGKTCIEPFNPDVAHFFILLALLRVGDVVVESKKHAMHVKKMGYRSQSTPYIPEIL